MRKPEKAYTIGKGKVLFKQDGQTNYADLGNSPDFKFTVKSEKKDHSSQRSGFAVVDDSALLSQTAEGSLTLDDLMDENMKMFLMASAIVDEAQTQATVSAQAVIADLDKWIDLGKLKLSSVVVKAETPEDWQDAEAYIAGDFVKAAATPNTVRQECTTPGTSGGTEPTWATTPGATTTDGTAVWTCRKLTYVLNTDYVLDTEVGHIMCLSEGDIEAAQALTIDFTHAAITSTRIDAATAKAIKGHLFFVGDPPKGKIRDVKGYVSLIPNGDYSAIGSDWMSIGFNISFEKNTAYTGLYEMRTRGVVAG